jgi:WD40 repeat protein
MQQEVEPPAVETGNLLVSADGRWAVIQSGASTRLWDVERREPVRELAGGHWGRALVATPGGRWQTVTSQSHTVRLCDLESGSVRALPGEIRSDVAAASWDGRRLVVGSDDWGDDPLVAWDLDSGRQLLDPSTGATFAVAISGDGRWIAGGFNGVEPLIRVWDLDTGTEAHLWEGLTRALAISFDGGWVVAGIGEEVRIWDARSGKEAGTLAGHARGIACVAITPHGGRVISGSEDKTIRVWDRETGAAIATFRLLEGAVTRCAVTPDGRMIAAADQLSRVYFLQVEAA